MIKTGTDGLRPITSAKQHEATFYGLAKAAGDTTQSASDNAVGTYTDTAKAAIRTMLGAVGNADYATTSNAGIVRISPGNGITINNGEIYLMVSSSSGIKAGTSGAYPVVPSHQHEAAFYGLAKAAGDTTQSQSSNAVGTYTSDAKAAIQTMLGVPGDI